jgi:hypothetical protein
MKKTKHRYVYFAAMAAALCLGSISSLATAPRGVLSEKAKAASVSPVSEMERENVYRAEFSFTGTEATLPIFMTKKLTKEVFVSGVKISSQEPADIVKAAEYYYKKKYSDAIVKELADSYEIIFTTRLGKFQNFSFPSRARLDRRGNLIKLEQSDAEYESVYEAKIIPPMEAFNKLPAPQSLTRGPITLETCEIVYIYENSLAQPAYLFKGKTREGEAFEAVVKASKF